MPAPAPCANTSKTCALFGFMRSPDTVPACSLTKNSISLTCDGVTANYSPSGAAEVHFSTLHHVFQLCVVSLDHAFDRLQLAAPEVSPSRVSFQVPSR